MCGIVFELGKGRGRAVNRLSVYVKGVYEKFCRILKKSSVSEFLCGVFLWILRNLQEHIFLHNSNGPLSLNIAVSIVAKRVLANETVIYETRNKAYVLIWARSVSYYKGQSRWKNRFQKQAFADLKLGALKNFISHKKTFLLESLFNKAAGLNICNSIKNRLRYSFFPVKLAKFLKTPFLLFYV